MSHCLLNVLCLNLNWSFRRWPRKSRQSYCFMFKALTFIPKSRLKEKPFKPFKPFPINAELSPFQIKRNGTYGELLSSRPSPQMTDRSSEDSRSESSGGKFSPTPAYQLCCAVVMNGVCCEMIRRRPTLANRRSRKCPSTSPFRKLFF